MTAEAPSVWSAQMLKTLFQKREPLNREVRDVAYEAAETIFASMFGSKPTFTPDTRDRRGDDGVVGIISFDGQVEYTFALILPVETAPKLAMDFAGMEMEMDDPNMPFVAGELANLIAGDLVARMEANQIKTRMSLPSLSRGPDMVRSLAMGREVISMVFELPQGPAICQVASSPRFEHVSWPGE